MIKRENKRANWCWVLNKLAWTVPGRVNTHVGFSAQERSDVIDFTPSPQSLGARPKAPKEAVALPDFFPTKTEQILYSLALFCN